jgi:hypothetical protein
VPRCGLGRPTPVVSVAEVIHELGQGVRRVIDVLRPRARCSDRRCTAGSWTIYPADAYPHRSYQLDVVASAVAEVCLGGSPRRAVAEHHACSRRSVSRWVRWTAQLAPPEDLARWGARLDPWGLPPPTPASTGGEVSRAGTVLRLLEHLAEVLLRRGVALSGRGPGLGRVLGAQRVRFGDVAWLTRSSPPLRVPRGRSPCGCHGGACSRRREPRNASRLVPRYERRLPEVNETVLATYLAGANSRRLRSALRPLLKAAPLSKSAVSRVVATLKAEVDAWRTRPLADVDGLGLYLDAVALRVRSAGEVVSAPALGVVAVLTDGQKQLLTLERCPGGETYAAWKGCLDDLVARGLAAPLWSVIDGHPGLRKAVGLVWPRVLVQRCGVHNRGPCVQLPQVTKAKSPDQQGWQTARAKR